MHTAFACERRVGPEPRAGEAEHGEDPPFAGAARAAIGNFIYFYLLGAQPVSWARDG